MSFLKSIFGLGKDDKPTAPTVDAQEEYEGFTIKVALMQAGGEHQIAGSIEKEIDGELRIEKFIRADKFASRDDAIAATLAKGRQIIKEQKRTLFT
ncbi:HlyU family transcriptional regulator [Pelagibacterium montanilacus]|uniref:HlyU family transcriptional regulator n=1 Tax=Pelagibacterium montanilacus TaxID=2185280 RepID=UPI000F8F13E7|nr:HlyU family transcriptional regulator [Pelagibacterium montanilacus]